MLSTGFRRKASAPAARARSVAGGDQGLHRRGVAQVLGRQCAWRLLLHARGAADHGAEEVRQDHQHRLDRRHRRVQRPSPGLLRDQGRRARLHAFGGDRGRRRQHLCQCHRRRRNPDAADGDYLAAPPRKPAMPCIKSSRSGAWASRRNTPRSPSTSRRTSTTSSGRRSVRTAARSFEAAGSEFVEAQLGSGIREERDAEPFSADAVALIPTAPA